MSRGWGFDRWLLITCVTSVVTFFLADGSPMLAAAAIGLGALGRTLTSGGREKQAPRWLLTALAAMGVIWAARESLRNPEDFVSAVGGVFAWIMVLKTFDRSGVRDRALMLVLAVFSVIAALLTSNSFATGIAVAVFTPMALWTAMLYQTELGGAASRPTTRGAIPDARGDGAQSDLSTAGRRGLRWLTVWTTAACSIVALCVFVLLPRNVGEEMFGPLTAPAAGATVGFNDEVVLGRSGEMAESQETVIDLVLTDRAGRNLGSEDRRVLLRGAALDDYDDARDVWRAGGASGWQTPFLVATANSPAAVSARTTPLGDDVLVQRVTIRSRQGEYLFTVFRPVEIRPDREVALSRDDRDLTLRARVGQRGGGRLSYTVVSQPDYVPAPASSQTAPRLSPLFREGRIRQLAEQVLRDAGLSRDADQWHVEADQQIVRLFERYLQQNYTYDAYQTAPEAREEPLEMFLFRTRRGHCEYFASALAAMCRSVGIDARVVTGFAATDFNAISGAYAVRQSDAHAWVEALVEPGRWMTLDPSPPAGVAATRRQARGPFAAVRNLYSAVEQAWVSWIVGFDTRSRRSLLGDGGAIGAFMARAADLANDLSPGQTIRRAGRAAFVGAVVFLACSAAGFAAVGVWRVVRRSLRARRAARARDAGMTPDQRAQVEFYAALLRGLRAIGEPKPAWRPPIAHADAIASSESAGVAAPAVRRLAELYYAVRFGGRMLSAEEIADAQRHLAAVHAAGREAQKAARHGR